MTHLIDFAVNEQCFQIGECAAYASFLASNKPVFNIEYPQPLNAAAVQGPACKNPVVGGMSTALKDLTLDGRVIYCDGGGVVVDTPTVGGTSPSKPSRPPKPVPTASSTRPAVPSRSSTTTKTTMTRSQTTTTDIPTGVPGGGGCRSKHWDQCGGQNWNGCTVCEVLSRDVIYEENCADFCCSLRIRVRAFHRRGIINVCERCHFALSILASMGRGTPGATELRKSCDIQDYRDPSGGYVSQSSV